MISFEGTMFKEVIEEGNVAMEVNGVYYIFSNFCLNKTLKLTNYII